MNSDLTKIYILTLLLVNYPGHSRGSRSYYLRQERLVLWAKLIPGN